MATDLIPLANAHGFSPDICSYLTSDIGSFLKNETPLQKMGLSGVPKADVLVFNTNQCRDVKDWFQWYARQWNVPCIGIHTPRGDRATWTTPLVDYVAKQTRGAGRAAGAGRRDEVRYRPAAGSGRLVASSARCCGSRCSKSATHVPSPITFFDGTIQMGPAVVLRGTQDAVDYYRVLVDELNQRIAQGVAAVEGERLRIYWEGMPIWGKLRDMSTQFLQLRICVVASTYCNSWIFEDLDPADPFRGMARAYSSIFICRSDDYKEAYIERMAKEYQVDGILYHDAKTCPNNSNSRYELPQRLRERLGKPFLTINGDLNDLRLYSEEQARTNIEAFAEQLMQA